MVIRSFKVTTKSIKLNLILEKKITLLLGPIDQEVFLTRKNKMILNHLILQLFCMFQNTQVTICNRNLQRPIIQKCV